MSDFLKDYYDTEGPLGLPMTDAQATALDALLRRLPKDDLHAPGHLSVEKAPELLPGERADISWISTEDTDRYHDVVLAAPGDSPTVMSSPTPFLLENYNSATSIRLFASSFGANLNAATQDVIKVGILVALGK